MTRPVARWHLHRRLYDWVLQWADSRYGGWALFGLAFAESSFFPVPPDVLLGPLVLGNRRKWLRFALICSLASVIGGAAGYGIGRFAWLALGPVFHDHVPGFSRDRLQLVEDSEPRACLIENARVTLRPFLEPHITWPMQVVYPDGRRAELHEADVVNGSIEMHAYTRVITGYRDTRVGTAIVALAGFTPIPYKVITITAGAAHVSLVLFLVVSTLSRSARFFLVAGLFGYFGDRIAPFVDRYFNWLCLLFAVLLIGGFAVLRYVG